MFVSYYLDVASGASIVLLSAGLFALTLVYVSVRQSIRVGRSTLALNELSASEAEALR
jgi:hypothetical protein